MSEITSLGWSEDAELSEEAILRRLKQTAQDGLNLSAEQIALIDPATPLIDGLRLDSLAQVVLVTNVEQEFGCVFEPEDWQQLVTVGDLVKLISERSRAEGDL